MSLAEIKLALSCFDWTIYAQAMEAWSCRDDQLSRPGRSERDAIEAWSRQIQRIEDACRQYVTEGGSPMELVKAWAEMGPKDREIPRRWLEAVKHPPKVKRPFLSVEVDNNPGGITAARVRLGDDVLASFTGPGEEVDQAARAFAETYAAERRVETPCTCGRCVDSVRNRRGPLPSERMTKESA